MTLPKRKKRKFHLKSFYGTKWRRLVVITIVKRKMMLKAFFLVCCYFAFQFSAILFYLIQFILWKIHAECGWAAFEMIWRDIYLCWKNMKECLTGTIKSEFCWMLFDCVKFERKIAQKIWIIVKNLKFERNFQNFWSLRNR